jgi:GNAT superfamily N-acetyltransferase
MLIRVDPTDFKSIEPLRALYRQEANCQIIHDSCLARGLADGYLIQLDGRPAGYGGIWNKYDPGQLMEFYTLPVARPHALPMIKELIAASRATRMEAQTNMPLMVTMLFDVAQNIKAENVLFADAVTTRLACPGAIFRPAGDADAERVSPEEREAIGQYVLEAEGALVATGGFLCHYNPPYGDIYMHVFEPHRKMGYGSYIVQELKRVCLEAGKRPAARCNADNHLSRRTLQKAGFLPCGRLLTGEIIKSQ